MRGRQPSRQLRRCVPHTRRTLSCGRTLAVGLEQAYCRSRRDIQGFGTGGKRNRGTQLCRGDEFRRQARTFVAHQPEYRSAEIEVVEARAAMSDCCHRRRGAGSPAPRADRPARGWPEKKCAPCPPRSARAVHAPAQPGPSSTLRTPGSGGGAQDRADVAGILHRIQQHGIARRQFRRCLRNVDHGGDAGRRSDPGQFAEQAVTQAQAINARRALQQGGDFGARPARLR
jgi:hypothetical protein